MFVAAGAHAAIEVGLQIGAVTQHVVVSATAGEVPQSQVGAAVTVIDSTLIQTLGNTDLLEPLRTVPGAAIVADRRARRRRLAVRARRRRPTSPRC